MTEGTCDLLVAYHHASQPLQLSPERYEMLSLGQETLAPYAKAGPDGAPMYRLAAGAGRIPFLGYASGAYMAGLVDQILKSSSVLPHLDTLYETDMAEGLKAMALEGHGVAFLPSSSVKKELRAKRLVPAGPLNDETGHVYDITMEVRMYRERPELVRHPKQGALALWDFLKTG
jgi:DNA-binding transcriptional LysR family regulator